MPFVNEAIAKAKSKTVGEALLEAQLFPNSTEVKHSGLCCEIPLPKEEKPLSYTLGDIACCFTEDEVTFLVKCLDTIQEHHPTIQPYGMPENVALFESIEKKITDLYDDHCVRYELSPALKAYYEKYGTWGTENEAEVARWHGFRDAFSLLYEITEQ